MGALLGILEISTLGEVATQAVGAAAVEIDLTALKPASMSYPIVVTMTCDQDCYVRQGRSGLTAAASSNAWPLWQKGERQVVIYSVASAYLSVIRNSTDGTLHYMIQNNQEPNA